VIEVRGEAQFDALPLFSHRLDGVDSCPYTLAVRFGKRISVLDAVRQIVREELSPARRGWGPTRRSGRRRAIAPVSQCVGCVDPWVVLRESGRVSSLSTSRLPPASRHATGSAFRCRS